MLFPEIPENGMKPQLEEIRYIAGKVAEEDETAARAMFVFFPPASEEDIISLEGALGCALPESYKDFLRFSDGAVFCGNTAEFYSAKTAKARAGLERADCVPEDWVFIADIIGDGEKLCFSKETGCFMTYYDGEQTVYDDLGEFFERRLIGHIRDKAEDFAEL